MSNNFAPIGFLAETMEEFDAIIGNILDDGQNIRQYDTPAGTYLCWKQDDAFGPEVFIQIVDKQIACFAPYFRGKSEVLVGFTNEIPLPNGTPLEAYLYGWAEPEQDDPESGAYPFVCEMMALHAYDEIEFPFLNMTSICAIAKEVDIYADEKAYDKAIENEETPMASESFIPVGLFPPDDGDDEDFIPEPIAIFTGKILETKEMKNSLTGHKFHWALVKTLGGTFDVVISPEEVKAPLKKNGIVHGAFHLTTDFK